MDFYSITNFKTKKTEYYRFLKSLAIDNNLSYRSTSQAKSKHGTPFCHKNFVIDKHSINDWKPRK